MPHIHASSQDPTRTKTVRREYGRRLRGAYERVNARIREGIVEDDVFDLRDSGSLTAAERPPDLSHLSDAEKVEQFEEWLDDALDSETIEVIDRGDNTYIQRAYERGVERSDVELRKDGFDIPQTEAAAVIQKPIHQRKLDVLFRRNYSELDGLNDEMARRLTRELANGLSEGLNPRDMARNISGEMSVAKNRATLIARSETVRAHSQASIERYREMGIEEVGLEPEVELATATDQRVCQQCAEAAQQGPWDLDEFEGSEFQPPIHPNCRCSISANNKQN